MPVESAETRPDPLYTPIDEAERRTMRAAFRASRDTERAQAQKLHQEGTQAERLAYIEGVKSFGNSALKSVLILNGGAIIAAMTFLGSLLAKGEHGSTLVAVSIAPSVSSGITYFIIGLVLCPLAYGVGYINYSTMVEIVDEPIDHLLRHYGQVVATKAEWKYRFTFITAWTAFTLAIISLACFARGCFLMTNALSRLGA